MSDERCGDCAGLGARVETYRATDGEGYSFLAQKQVVCDACHGTGRV